MRWDAVLMRKFFGGSPNERRFPSILTYAVPLPTNNKFLGFAKEVSKESSARSRKAGRPGKDNHIPNFGFVVLTLNPPHYSAIVETTFNQKLSTYFRSFGRAIIVYCLSGGSSRNFTFPPAEIRGFGLPCRHSRNQLLHCTSSQRY